MYVSVSHAAYNHTTKQCVTYPKTVEKSTTPGDLPAYREKLMTLRNIEVLPIMKARKSVRDVMVIPMPAMDRVAPRRLGNGISTSPSVSLHADITRNMSSIPIPEGQKQGAAWFRVTVH